ncbi:MAG TPA: thioredoxin family protein [Opitutales bacterium]|jgi:thiol-disulfide isomerase/thioredoxin|nr:thioredoxin family protein [Opitutales bacterium]
MSDEGTPQTNPLKFALVAGLAIYCVNYAATPDQNHFLDGLDLLLHEAGHEIFRPLGEVIYFLGGSMMQCLMPFAFLVQFCRQRDFYAAAVMGFWVSINIFSVSVYAGDAIQMKLPLLGGDSVTHDWNWIMIHFNALQYTDQVAAVIRWSGYAMLTASAVTGIMFSRDWISAPAAPQPATAAAGTDPLLVNPYEPNVAALAAMTAHQDKFSPQVFASKKPLYIALAGCVGLALLYNHGFSGLWQSLTGGGSKTPWPSDYAAAVAQAQTEHKPIVLHFTGSDWCPACQELDENILDTSAFKDYAKKNLVFIDLDYPQHTAQPAELRKQNLELQQRFDVHAFPTIYILSSHGTVINKMEGCPEGIGPQTYIQMIDPYIKQGGVS